MVSIHILNTYGRKIVITKKLARLCFVEKYRVRWEWKGVFQLSGGVLSKFVLFWKAINTHIVVKNEAGCLISKLDHVQSFQSFIVWSD